jgi:hypothetical protein
MALLDPASAILMAAAYLFTVQQLNRPGQKTVKSEKTVYQLQVEVDEQIKKRMMNNMNNMNNMNHRENFDIAPVVANKEVMAPALAIASETHSEHPAFQTMTENLAKQGVFTSDLQFKDAQSNFVPGIDQNVGIKTLENQFSAQGIDLPRGFDTEVFMGAEF